MGYYDIKKDIGEYMIIENDKDPSSSINLKGSFCGGKKKKTASRKINKRRTIKRKRQSRRMSQIKKRNKRKTNKRKTNEY